MAQWLEASIWNHEVDGVLWLLGFGSLHSSYSSGLLDDGEVFLVIL